MCFTSLVIHWNDHENNLEPEHNDGTIKNWSKTMEPEHNDGTIKQFSS